MPRSNHKKTTSNNEPLALEMLFTPKQVARAFRVKESTVLAWLRRGLMRGVKAGHAWRVTQRAIDEFKGEYN